MEESLVEIAWRILALASASAGAARVSGSSGVGGGNSRLAAAATMTTCGSRNGKRIAIAVEACGGVNSLHHFAWRRQKRIVVKTNNF